MGTRDAIPSKDNGGRWIFYYDGNCGLCRWLVKWARRIDLAGSVAWVPFQSVDAPPEGLSWDDLDRSAYLETDRGKLYPGFFALRKLTLKLPLLWPLAPIFWLPGTQLPGRAAYRWVANNRYRLSRCGLSGKSSPGGG